MIRLGQEVLYEAPDHKWREKEVASARDLADLVLPKEGITHSDSFVLLSLDFHGFEEPDGSVERRLAILEHDVRDLMARQPHVARPPFDVDIVELLATFSVDDPTELRHRVGSRPKLYAKLEGAAERIRSLFDERPRISFEQSSIIVRIQTKLEADEASRLHDKFLDEWWLTNIRVEDRMSLTIDFV